MNPEIRPLLNGFVAFVVATAATVAADPDRDFGGAIRLGGSIGGAVALGTYLGARVFGDGRDQH